ncbi:MAG: hypothetical protein U0324_21430 [Polyangiales bacterium]
MSAHATDPRTAARVATLRAACALPLVRAHGSLEGRAGGDVLAAAMEPDGRHVALVLRDAVERWTLDPLACVGRWEAAAPATAGESICVGDAPAGLRFSAWNGLWRASPDGAWGPLHAHPRTLARPDAPDVLLDLHRRELRVVDLADGATLRLDALPATTGWLFFAPGGRFALHRRASDTFEVWEASPDVDRAAASPWRVASHLPLPSHALHAPECPVALHPASRLVAITTGAGVLVGRWDAWDRATLVEGASPRAVEAAFSGDGATLFLRDAAGVLRVDPATRTARAAPLPPGCGGAGVRVVHHGRRAVLLAGGALHVLDEGAEAFRSVAYDPAAGTRCAAGTPDGRALVTATADGVLRVRDRATGEVTALAEVDGAPAHLAVSPDGRELLVATERGDLARLDRATGARLDHVFAAFGLHAGSYGGFAVSPDGRRVALCDHARDRVRAVEVDLVTRAPRTLRGDGAGARGWPWGVAFTAEGRARLAFEEATPRTDVRALACVELDVEGAARSLLWRQLPPTLEAGRPWRAALALSRDGRLLWGVLSDGRDGVGFAFRVALDAPRADDPQWPVDGAVRSCRAGTERFAVSTWNDALWLFDLRGDVRRVAWPGGCDPLAFAPDDGALWVRDASGLVVEVSTSAAPRV